MKMERTPPNSGIRWRNPLQSRNWNVDMIPHVSRPTSRISRIGSLHRGHQDVDWISLGGSRMSSRTNSSSSLFDSPPNYGYRHGRPKRRGIIEDLLTKHAAMRPRSISLAKYEPLPSIGQDSPRTKMDSKRASSVGSLIKESHKPQLSDKQTKSDEGPLSIVKSPDGSSESMECNLEEPDAESTAADGPPKLIRSRTFDVIETNLTNLPVIGEPSPDDESSEERESAFIDESHFLNLSGPTDISRRSSHSSLFTHPGTPDSGYVAVFPKSQGLFTGGYEHEVGEVNNSTSFADENFYENVASLLPDGSE